jgi:hypothetical protein
MHLTPAQKQYVSEIGGSLRLGDYQLKRLPTTALQELVAPDVFVLGRSSNGLISNEQRNLVRVQAGLGPLAEVRSFTRAFLNQETVMGTSYRRSRRRINSVVVYQANNQGAQLIQVHSFHVVQHGNQTRLIALGRQVEKVPGLFAEGTPLVTQEHLGHLNQAFLKVHPIL